MERTLFSPATYYALAAEFESLEQQELLCIPGKIPVLITSIHGHTHIRNNTLKRADDGTLKFAYLLAKLTGAHLFAVNTPGTVDSNCHTDTTFKRQLQEYKNHHHLELLLDIHASHECRIADIEYGTMHGRSLLGDFTYLNEAVERARDYFFVCMVDEIFKGTGDDSGCETMVRFGSEKLLIPSLQCEINAALVIADETLHSLHRHCQLLNYLAEIVLWKKEHLG